MSFFITPSPSVDIYISGNIAIGKSVPPTYLYTLDVSGNVSITGNTIISGNGNINGTTFTNTISPISGTALIIGNSLGTTTVLGTLVAGTLSGTTTTSGSFKITNSTVSSNTASGALVITGGVGIGNNLYVSLLTSSGSFNTTSDYRIKSNVKNVSNEYSVENLYPKIYYNEILQKNDIGFIAHEVQEHYPFLVNGEKDGNEYQSINYTGLIPILVNEIKLLKKRVFVLECSEL